MDGQSKTAPPLPSQRSCAVGRCLVDGKHGSGQGRTSATESFEGYGEASGQTQRRQAVQQLHAIRSQQQLLRSLKER